MTDVREVYEMVTQQTPPKPDALERQRKRQMRHTMNRKLGGFAVAAVIAGLAFLAVRASVGDGGQPAATPTGTGTSVAVPGVPEVDYVIDLNTGEMTPLPEAIIRTLGETDTRHQPRSGYVSVSGQYAASPDGSLLAYVGTGDEGTLQIFIARIDGTRIRQMTHDPRDVASPAWSPDGTSIAYLGYGDGDVRNLFVLDVATGESTQITDRTRGGLGLGLQFTPDGSSIVHTGGTEDYPVARIVPVGGGKPTVLFDLDAGNGRPLLDTGGASVSPDGSLVTFLGSDGSGGPQRFVANADGTERRLLTGHASNPAGTWSPDGSRIVCLGHWPSGDIIVIDIATGDTSPVAEGSGAIWLDDHTLLVQV